MVVAHLSFIGDMIANCLSSSSGYFTLSDSFPKRSLNLRYMSCIVDVYSRDGSVHDPLVSELWPVVVF